MPTGVDLLKRIRGAGHSTYVVLNSGTDNVRTIAEAFDCGLDKFIPKPADVQAFCDVIDELSGRHIPSAGDEAREVIGESRAANRLRQDIRSCAAEGVHPVLVTGPTGAGKERVAQAIHRLSPRSAHPLVAVDCPGIPASLFESRLFGHEQGAFTGATQRLEGDFRQVGKGTLVFDEVGELPLELQPKLLRVLESRRFRPVGSARELEFEGRFVFVTNRNLAAAVAERSFREDLYHRMAVLVVAVPALDERPEDMPLIIADLVQELASGRRLSEATLRALCDRSWPGNVRELRAALVRLLNGSEGRATKDALKLEPEEAEIDRVARRLLPGGERRLRLVGRRMYEIASEETGGSIRAIAARLGASRGKVARALAAPGKEKREPASGEWTAQRPASDEEDGDTRNTG
jgi:DNA-binding NtrC family response regulator